MPYSLTDIPPSRPLTGLVNGTVTGTAIGMTGGMNYTGSISIPVTSLQLVAHPSNTGTVWVLSNPGSIGYPIKPGVESLYLDSLADMSEIWLWFEKANDKICYMALQPLP